MFGQGLSEVQVHLLLPGVELERHVVVYRFCGSYDTTTATTTTTTTVHWQPVALRGGGPR